MNSSSFTQRLSWVRLHSPLTRAALARIPSKPDARLVVRFHIDLKMIPVIGKLSENLSLLVFPCSSDTTDEEGWRFLQEQSAARLEENWCPRVAEEFLSSGSGGYLCDLGGEMIAWALRERFPLRGAMEGTTSGLTLIRERLGDCPAEFPILDWNGSRLKREIHNEKMVGYSLWQTFSEVTRLSLHGKSVGLFGFGPVGRGIARSARSLGALVRICDRDPDCRVAASFEGFETTDSNHLLRCSDIVVTATGGRDVIRARDLELLPDGTMLLNAGHSEEEISSDVRHHESRVQVLDQVEEISLRGHRTVFLLARGRLLNLAAGFGDSINGFDVTSALLVEGIRRMLDQGETGPGLRTMN